MPPSSDVTHETSNSGTGFVSPEGATGRWLFAAAAAVSGVCVS